MVTTGKAEQALLAAELDMDELRQRELEAHVLYYAEHPEEIDKRLIELDREWDVDRVTEAELGLTALTGFMLGLFRRKWTLLGLAATGLLGYHGIKGRSPVGLLYRRLGFRTMEEIDRERYALKALRGDFEGLAAVDGADLLEKAGRAMTASF